MTNLDSILKQRRHIANKGLHSQSYVLSSSHIWMWELDHQEGWVWKIYFLELWCWRIFLRVHWTIKIKTVNPKRNQPWIFIGRTDAEAETPILWSPDVKSRQSRFDAQYRMLGAGALGWSRGMVQGRRREEGSGWGTHVYLWQIHVDIWQNKYNIVKLKNKIKLKKKH